MTDRPQDVVTGQRFSCNVSHDDFIFVMDELSGIGNARIKQYRKGEQEGDIVFLKPEPLRAMRDKLTLLLHKMDELQEEEDDCNW